MIEELHPPSNAQRLQKRNVETIKATAPVLAEVDKQSVREGIYNIRLCLVELRPMAVTQPGLFVPVIWGLKERE